MLYRLFRGVAKYIVYGNTFSSFGWQRSLQGTTGVKGSQKQVENDQPGQNKELVSKRGTTSVAWTRVFKHCSFKTQNTRAICVRRVRGADLFFRFIGFERLHKHTYVSESLSLQVSS